MTGEVSYAQQLIADAMRHAESDSSMSKDAMGRAVINAVIAEYRRFRNVDDIASELRYLIDTLDEDEFVITRGS
jgi:hypothetical protein